MKNQQKLYYFSDIKITMLYLHDAGIWLMIEYLILILEFNFCSHQGR